MTDLAARARRRNGRPPIVPLRAIGPTPHNLPEELSSFVGRARELAEVIEVLGTTRLLTLSGAGGCGKSRLAARAAMNVLPGFPDGVWWIELATLSGREELNLAVAQQLGIRPGQGQTGLDAVLAHLSTATSLVILDNCEHVLDAAAELAAALIRGCPGVTVLATSREALRVDGETDWRVPSLSLSPSGTAGDESDAVRLFAARAAQVRPGFSLNVENAPSVARICRELDGIPLAIELAATRLRVLSVEQLADALSERFRVLTGGTRTALARHRTLRASVDWSHDVLSDAERTLFRRLGVFLGGFTLQAAEQVCGGDGIEAAEVFEKVAALVDKSLVQADEHQGVDTRKRSGVVRYRLLETIRQYALERLAEAGEADRVFDRHRDAYLALAEGIEPDLRTPRQPEVLDLLDPEAANFTQAIERAACTEPEKGLRLCVALTTWWQSRGSYRQGKACLATALAAATEPSLTRARALWCRALLLTMTGAFADALPAADRALAEAQRLGDEQTVGRAYWLLGTLELFPAPGSCRTHLERALELASASGDTYTTAMCTMAVAYSYLHQNDLRRAKPRYEAALRQGEAMGQRDLIAWCKAASGWAHYILAEHDTCRTDASAAIEAARDIGDVVSEMSATCSLSLSDIDAGQPERALDRLTTARRRTLALGAGFILPVAEVYIGWAHAAAGRLGEARSWLEEVIGRGAGGYSFALVMANAGLADVLLLQGRDERAAEVGVRALELAECNADRFSCAKVRLTLGRLAAGRGRWTEAQRMHHDALSVIVADDYRVLLPAALEAVTEDAAGLGRPLDAARILGAAGEARAALGLVDWVPKRARLEAFSERLSEELGGEGYRAAVAAGADLTADEAVAFVRRARGTRKRPCHGWESLTPTELDVARHAGDGLTNPQIAQRMFITRGTVKGHLAHIYTKLGVRNRAELASEVARRREVGPDQ